MGALAAVYDRLGFTLTPPAQHPFGTGNQLAQLDGNFIELLAVTRPQDIPAALAGHFSFGGYNQDYLKAGDGFSMIALKSHGWQADRAHFEAEGLDLSAPFEFSRLARQPDGTEVTVGFKLTFATHPALPRAVFFTCDHQHEPQHFYKPQFQTHANSAVGIAEVMMVCDDSQTLQPYFEALIGRDAVTALDDGLAVQAGQAMISLTSRSELSERFLGASIGSAGEPRFIGYGVAVRDINVAETAISKGGFAYQRRGNSLWLCSADTSNVIIEFTQTQGSE